MFHTVLSAPGENLPERTHPSLDLSFPKLKSEEIYSFIDKHFWDIFIPVFLPAHLPTNPLTSV